MYKKGADVARKQKYFKFKKKKKPHGFSYFAVKKHFCENINLPLSIQL